MSTALTLIRRLRSDQRGVSLIEFALVAPVLIMVIMATFDLGLQLYLTTVLQGEMQKAGRAATLEGGANNSSAIDAVVRQQVEHALPSITNNEVTFTRYAYQNFSAAAKSAPEPWTDTDHDGVCDHGEPFTDENGNGVWDANGGANGQGGAQDAVLYSAKVSYPRIFPMASLLGWSKNMTITASTVLANQPYGQQASYTPTPGICP